VSAPVIDHDGKLLGRITIDDVVDVIRDDAEHSLMGMAGLDEEDDTFAPVIKTSKRRAVWLGVHLISAFTASFVISRFSDTIDRIVAVAVLMGVVASMGGVAGNQTLTLVIRAMALGKIGKTNAMWLVKRELKVIALNGIFWATIAGSITAWWFEDIRLGLIFGTAMIINLIIAALTGAFLPLFLKSVKIDPALAGGVGLIALTDVLGFLTFLSLVTIFY